MKLIVISRVRWRNGVRCRHEYVVVVSTLPLQVAVAGCGSGCRVFRVFLLRVRDE